MTDDTSAKKASTWQKLCQAGKWRLAPSGLLKKMVENREQIKGYLLENLIDEAEQLFQSTDWQSAETLERNLRAMWSLAVEQRLSTQAKAWLKSKMAFVDSLPEWGAVAASDLEEATKWWRRLNIYNHDLLVGLSTEPRFTQGWLAVQGCMLVGSANTQIPEEVDLWEKLLANSPNAYLPRLTRTESLAGALEEGNYLGAKWLLEKDRQFCTQHGQGYSDFKFILQGLRNMDLSTLDATKLEKTLELITWQEIDWNALKGFHSYRIDDMIDKIRAKMEAKNLEQKLPEPQANQPKNVCRL